MTNKIELQLSSEYRQISIFQYRIGEDFDYKTVIARIENGEGSEAFQGIDALYMFNWIINAFRRGTPETIDAAQQLTQHVFQYTKGTATTQLRMEIEDMLSYHNHAAQSFQRKYWIDFLNNYFNSSGSMMLAKQLAKNAILDNDSNYFTHTDIPNKQHLLLLLVIYGGLKFSGGNFSFEKMHALILDKLQLPEIGVFELDAILIAQDNKSNTYISGWKKNPFILSLSDSTRRTLERELQELSTGYLAYYNQMAHLLHTMNTAPNATQDALELNLEI